MKIKESELKQIIKEETLRLKKIISLQEEKANIKKQLSENGDFYGESIEENDSAEVEALLAQSLGNSAQTQEPATAQEPAQIPTQNPPQIEEGIIGNIGEKIKKAAATATNSAQSIVAKQLQTLNPEQIQQLKSVFAPFKGKSVAQLAGIAKGRLAESMLEEAFNAKNIKERIGQALQAIGIASGALGVLTGIAGMIAMQIIQFFPTVQPIFIGAFIAIAIGITLDTIGKQLDKY